MKPPTGLSGAVRGLLLMLALVAGGAPGADEPVEEKDVKPRAWYRNVVPLPVIITEPAVGNGLGLAFGYFHPAKAGDYSPRRIEDPNAVRDLSIARKPPPTVTGVFGAYTSNGTWAGGFGHVDSFRSDTIRYTGVVAFANVVADFYVFDQPFEFNLEGTVLYNDFKFRLGQSDWFLGAALTWLDAQNTFSVEVPVNFAQLDLLASEFSDVGLKALAMYETRDDSMMPRSGWLIDASVTRNDEALGGSYDYTTTKLKSLYFHPLHERFVLGLRLETSSVFGDPPFYAVPWVTMRGIPAMRFQGETVAMAEIEGRYYVGENWLVSGFAGRGRARSDILGMETEQDISAWGLGGRYRMLKEQNVWVGVDYAFGPEDDVVYIQVGQAW